MFRLNFLEGSWSSYIVLIILESGTLSYKIASSFRQKLNLLPNFQLQKIILVSFKCFFFCPVGIQNLRNEFGPAAILFMTIQGMNTAVGSTLNSHPLFCSFSFDPGHDRFRLLEEFLKFFVKKTLKSKFQWKAHFTVLTTIPYRHLLGCLG